jgi:hypothetical protein
MTAAIQDRNRLLPQSPDAEQAVLCSFLLNPREVGGLCVEKGVTLEDFHTPAHADIYAVLLDLWKAAKPIDLITLTQVLRERNQLEQVGGAAYVTELFTFIPTAANAACYIEILKENRTRREVIEYAERIRETAFAPGDNIGELIQRIREGAATIAQDVQHGLPRIEDGTEAVRLYGQDVPPEIISGMLHQGGKMMLGGASKSFKTWNLLDLGLSVASGTSWMGLPTAKRKVLYVNFELPRFSIATRQNAICEAKGISLKKGELDVWNLRGYCTDLSTLAPQIISRARDAGYGLIILDPLYKCIGKRDENAAGDIASLLNEIERLSVETGAAVAFGSHFAKGNSSSKEAIDRVSGSGVFARDPDAILMLTQHEEESAFAVESILRNFPPMMPFTVRWQHPLLVRDALLDPARLKKQRTGREPIYGVQDVVDKLGLEEMQTTEFKKLVCEETGMGKDTFYRLRDKAKSQKLIHQTATGAWSRL